MRTLVTVLLTAVVLFPLTAGATIWYVPDNFSTIQAGINGIPDGDTLVVREGTWYENLDFNGHNVVLASLFLTTGDTAYISSTIIDGDSAGSVITFQSGEDSTAQVVGFTICNGLGAALWPEYSGGGVTCLRTSSPRIRNNSICSNFAEGRGGGVYCDNSSPTISNNAITDNLTGRDGGGIYCYNNSQATISNNTISGNLTDRFGCAGGIYCSHSSPTISNNSISRNRAQDSGGGIHCWSSSPRISNNSVCGNRARYGAGIDCSGGSNPIIHNNAISGNSANIHGGGISCHDNCSPAISHNTIIGNTGADHGGGIDCYRDCNPTISHNTIGGNSANYGGGICYYSHCNLTISRNTIVGNSADCGGGIYSGGGRATISSNTISGNWASEYGGAINCSFSSATISNNTISENSAEYGGGIYSRYRSPTITNSILWGDTASNGPEIYATGGSNPTVTYCDIQGGWPGTGNIDADPIFVGPYDEDFHLRWHSPCIDAGDPDPQYNDPDGTRNDIGAFYFNQAVLGVVELYPSGEPIVIPPEGGDIFYDGWVFNFLGHPGRVDIWTYAFVPEMGQYGPLDLYENVRIPADSLGRNEITQHVPGAAPEGDYTFVAYVGDYPGTIIDSSHFYFTKTGLIAGGIADWFDGEGWFKEAGDQVSDLPINYSLLQNHPNPFNATTTISYQLPVDAYVKLEVYNTLGQKVATLVDSRQQAGYRRVVWDASQVSSGLYFYKLTAGDFTETRRMMLVK